MAGGTPPSTRPSGAQSSCSGTAPRFSPWEETPRPLARAARAGIGAERIVLDPGLGFGKTPGQNVELLRGLGALRSLGRPLLVGPSRKRFLGDLTARAPEERDLATAASCALAWESGA